MNVLVVGHAQVRDVNRDVYRVLARRGFDVTLLVPEHWKSSYGTIASEPLGAAGLSVVSQPIAGRHHSNLYWFPGGVARAARSCRADAIYVDEDPAGLAALQSARVARRLELRLVVLAVQNIFKRYPLPFDLIQRSVFATATSAVTNSTAASATLRRRGYRGPFFGKPLTTDIRPLEPAARAAERERLGLGRTTFGYVGRLVAEKGVDVFLDALARVPDVDGIVVGAGPERERLESRATRLGLSARLRFTGPLPPSEAATIIGSIDALVLPSRTTPGWSEQFGRVLVEAMASGTPIVASESGAIAEVVGDAGVLVPEDRPDRLAAALETLRSAPVAAELSTRGLLRATTRYSSLAAATELDRALRFTTKGTTR